MVNLAGRDYSKFDPSESPIAAVSDFQNVLTTLVEDTHRKIKSGGRKSRQKVVTSSFDYWISP